MMGVWFLMGKCVFPCCVTVIVERIVLIQLTVSEIHFTHTHTQAHGCITPYYIVFKLFSVESNNLSIAIVYWHSEGPCHE